jgi:hypothetical protein
VRIGVDLLDQESISKTKSNLRRQLYGKKVQKVQKVQNVEDDIENLAQGV